MDAFVFYAAGLVAVAASWIVVTRRNPIYSAIFLMLFFATISVQFLVLRAPFLAVVQLLVYAGAIMVLFLFVLMLLNLTPEELREEISARRKLGAAVASGALFALLTRTVWTSPAVRNAGDLAGELGETLADIGETREIAESLFAAHLLPFELTSFLILIAVVAALYLTGVRGRTEEGPSPEESP